MGFWRRIRGKGGYESGASVDARRTSQMGDYQQQSGGLDELGYSRNGINPPGEIADRVQAQSESIVGHRNARLNEDALGALQGGLGQLQSYRPGGAAAMASPYYSQMAQVLQNSQTQAPDLLHFSRTDAEMKARKASRNSANMQIAGTVIGAAATVAGAALAVPTGGGSMVGAMALMGLVNAGIAAQNRTPNGSANASDSAHGWGGMGTQGSLPQDGANTQGQGEVPGGMPPTPTSQPTKQVKQGGQGQGSPLGGGGGQFNVQGDGGQGQVSGGSGAQGMQGQGTVQGSPMADPGAAAFGMATPMGSSYPSREGAIAAGSALFGQATYDLVSNVVVKEFGEDPFWHNSNAAADALFDTLLDTLA